MMALTYEQIVEITRVAPTTERLKRIELMKAGLVVNSGRRLPTKTGHAATVWV